MYKNSPLREALARYTARRAVLLSEGHAEEQVPRLPQTIWQKHALATYQGLQGAKPLWWAVPALLKEKFQATDEYAACVRELRADQVVRPQLDTLVGTRLGGRRIEIDTIVNYPLIAIASELERFAFDASLFEREYLRLEQALYAQTIEIERLTPLQGFTADKDVIQLAPEVAITRLSDSEVISLLNSGVKLGFSIGGGMEFVTDVATFAIRIQFRLLKVVGDAAFQAPARDTIPFISGRTELQVLQGLRAFRAGAVRALGSITRHTELVFGGGTQFSLSPVQALPSPRYALTADEADSFAEFWRDSTRSSVLERVSIETAIRRLSYAAERTIDEDKIIDLLIGMEALLLSEQDDWSGEITYRLSHRAALFLETTPDNRRRVFDFFRAAYKVRSKIVHGSKNPSLPVKEGVARYTMPEFIGALEEYLRTAIKKAIKLSRDKTPRQDLLDWKAMMFDKGA